MNVTNDQILALLVLKDQKILGLEIELGRAREVQAATVAELEDTRKRLAEALEGKPATGSEG